MLVRSIYAAANKWDGILSTEPLPLDIPSQSLADIGMPYPPFPPDQYLAFNFLTILNDRAVIRSWIQIWQANGILLQAWIAEARKRCEERKVDSWFWPRLDPEYRGSPAHLVGTTPDRVRSPIDWAAVEVFGMYAGTLESDTPTPPDVDEDVDQLTNDISSLTSKRSHSAAFSDEEEQAKKKQLIKWYPLISDLLAQHLPIPQLQTVPSSSKTALAAPKRISKIKPPVIDLTYDD